MSDSIKTDRVPAALAEPGSDSPPRCAGSIRRTSHVDIRFVGEWLHLAGAARDLLTPTSGQALVCARATTVAMLDEVGRLDRLTTDPARPATDALLGSVVGAGFRAAVASAICPDM